MKVINVGNRITNQYALQTDKGIVILDTGYPKGFDAFKRRFEGKGLKKEDIRFIVLTHAHDDHAGFLNEMLDYCKAPVILHREAEERLKIGQNVFQGGCSSRLAHGFCQVLAWFGKGEHTYPSVQRPKRYIIAQEHSKVLREAGFKMDIMELPGHTADSIGIIWDDKIFCGDAAMNEFPSVAKHIIWIEDMDAYRQSWCRMMDLDVKWIYPSHGRPFEVKYLEKHKDYLNGKRLIPLN